MFLSTCKMHNSDTRSYFIFDKNNFLFALVPFAWLAKFSVIILKFRDLHDNTYTINYSISLQYLGLEKRHYF